MPSLQRPLSPFSPTCHQIRTRVSTATSRVHCATTCGASMGILHPPFFSLPSASLAMENPPPPRIPLRGEFGSSKSHSTSLAPCPLPLVRLHSLGSPSEGDPLIPPAPALWKAGCSGSTERTLPHNLPTGPCRHTTAPSRLPSGFPTSAETALCGKPPPRSHPPGYAP